MAESTNNSKPAATGRRPSSLMMVPLGIIAVVLVGAALREARAVILPLVFAWMLAQLLSPLIVFLAKRRVPAGLAIGFALTILLFIVYWTTAFVSVSAASFLKSLPEYEVQVRNVVGDIIYWTSTRFGSLSSDAISQEIREELLAMFGVMMQFTGVMAGALTKILANIILIFIILAFMLVGRPYGEMKIKQAFAPDTAERVGKIIGTISRQLSHYLSMQFLISLVTGLLVWLTCKLVGLEAAPTWGALAFFLNFIPTVGSILAGVPPVLLALLQFYPSIGPALIILVSIVIINQVLGNILAPKIMGDQLNLSPVVILLSVMFWGWLWGIAGAFLSVVITCSIKIVCENIPLLHPVSVMMASGKAIRRQAKAEEAEAAKQEDGGGGPPSEAQA